MMSGHWKMIYMKRNQDSPAFDNLYDFRNEYVCVSDLKCLFAEEK
jgi:hypothetical protein